MGTDIVTQCQQMTGITVAAIAEINLDSAKKALRISGRAEDGHAVADSAKSFTAALEAGKAAITQDAQLVCKSDHIDVVIDATGKPAVGAEIGLTAMEHGKHLVMMNVEADVTIGPYLAREARRLGVVYTLGAGDEPSSTMELVNFVTGLGYPIVAAGKGKNNPLDIYATPDELAARAKARDMSARMLCEFVDGSKTAVEMGSVANATGLVPDCRGMHGARATRDTLQQVFCPKSQGGVLEKKGVVDFAIGVHPGVFVVFTTDQPRLKHGLIQRDMGHGPNYLLFRPYHLCSIEVPLTAAQTVIYGESAGHPLARPVAECIALAKKDLKAGQTLDAIGEYTYRASIDLASTARAERLLPLGLAKGCVLKRDVPRDRAIAYDDLESVPETLLVKTRREQDRFNAEFETRNAEPDGAS
jgi:predicted homoserine dehydrogenase-like protein